MTRALLCLACLALISGAAVAQATGPVARVNNQPISDASFYQTLQDWYGRAALEEVIMAEVVAQGAAAAKVVVTDQEVEARVIAKKQELDALAQAGMGPSFEQWMQRNRLTLANVRYHLRTELLLEGLVKGQVNVTNEAIADFYTRNAKRFVEPAAVKISVIALKTKEAADAVRQSVVSGQKSWADASRESNVNPYTMQDAGDLGYCTNDGTPLAQAAFELQRDGDVSEPIPYDKHFYLVRRGDKRSERTVPFEEVRAQIEENLKAEQLGRLKEEARSALMKQARIERLIQFPEAPIEAPAPTAPPAAPAATP